ncbi:MAG: hypothetical protein RMY34_11825 [Aulosira sp. DedQUE10]|nr:hypothetical protein [Aulosira sp. DedQUE10]
MLEPTERDACGWWSDRILDALGKYLVQLYYKFRLKFWVDALIFDVYQLP